MQYFLISVVDSLQLMFTCIKTHWRWVQFFLFRILSNSDQVNWMIPVAAWRIAGKKIYQKCQTKNVNWRKIRPEKEGDGNIKFCKEWIDISCTPVHWTNIQISIVLKFSFWGRKRSNKIKYGEFRYSNFVPFLFQTMVVVQLWKH